MCLVKLSIRHKVADYCCRLEGRCLANKKVFIELNGSREIDETARGKKKKVCMGKVHGWTGGVTSLTRQGLTRQTGA